MYAYVTDNPTSLNDPSGLCGDPVSCGAELGGGIGTFVEPGGGTAIGATIGAGVGVGIAAYLLYRHFANRANDSQAKQGMGETNTGSEAVGSDKAGKPYANTEENRAKTAAGKPPIGTDGHPVELHHPDQDPNKPVQEMTRTEHRLGENYKKNHPHLGPININRSKFRTQKRRYWKAKYKEDLDR